MASVVVDVVVVILGLVNGTYTMVLAFGGDGVVVVVEVIVVVVVVDVVLVVVLVEVVGVKCNGLGIGNSLEALVDVTAGFHC